MTHYALFPTPLGHCGIAWRNDAVVGTRLPDANPADTGSRLAARTGATRGEPPATIRHAIASMIALLEGGRTDLSFVECDFGEIDRLAKEVYVVTRTIAAGETLTYGDIAVRMGDKRLAQRVGQALARNPVPIIVPCHRVIGAQGRLTGFSAHGGVQTKLRMLAIEGARIGGTLPLFDDGSLAARDPR